jgi:hypothetical protein
VLRCGGDEAFDSIALWCEVDWGKGYREFPALHGAGNWLR